MNLNNMTISGFLTRDPELRKTTTGKSVCTLGLAINSEYKGKHEVCYVDVKVWNASAEACAKYLKKGSGATVIGALKQDHWEKDGKTFYKHYVLAHRVEFGSSKGKANTADESPAAEAAPQEAQAPAPAVIPDAMMF